LNFSELLPHDNPKPFYDLYHAIWLRWSISTSDSLHVFSGIKMKGKQLAKIKEEKSERPNGAGCDFWTIAGKKRFFRVSKGVIPQRVHFADQG
jgi:hypothetical protein